MVSSVAVPVRPHPLSPSPRCGEGERLIRVCTNILSASSLTASLRIRRTWTPLDSRQAAADRVLAPELEAEEAPATEDLPSMLLSEGRISP